MRKVCFLVLLLFVVLSISAAKLDSTVRHGFVLPTAWNKPLWADVHPNLVRFDVSAITNRSEWDWGQTGKKYRVNTFATLGVDLPIWSGSIDNGRFAFAFTLPMSFTVWLDLFEPNTAPVVNTDYRIASPDFAFIHRVKNVGFFRNWGLRFSPFKHESTHIGDEMTLQRVAANLPIRRTNVSYNYAELSATINDADGRTDGNHCFRVGLMLLLKPHKGWYFIDETDGDAALANSQIAPYEVYLQYQYQTPQSKHHFQGIISAEIRNRARYGVPIFSRQTDGTWTMTPQKEKRAFTYNVFAGVRYCNPHYDGVFSKFGIGLRCYYGVNPYGQFRSHDGFLQSGISMIFE